MAKRATLPSGMIIDLSSHYSKDRRRTFSRLPYEIKLMIYEHTLIECPRWEKEHSTSCVFKSRNTDKTEIPPWLLVDIVLSYSPNPIQTSTRCPCAKRRGLNLLLTCKDINEAASPIFWSRNTFCFLDASEFTATVGSQLRIRHREQLRLVSIIDADCVGLVSGPYPCNRYRLFWKVIRECKDLQRLDVPAAYIKSGGVTQVAALASSHPNLSTLRLNFLNRYSNLYGFQGSDPRLPSNEGYQSIFVKFSRDVPLQQHWSEDVMSNLYKDLRTNLLVHADTAIKINFLGAHVESLLDWRDNWCLSSDLYQGTGSRRILLPTGEMLPIRFYGLPISRTTRLSLVKQRFQLDLQQKRLSGSTVAQHKVEMELAQRKKEKRANQALREMNEYTQKLADRRVRAIKFAEQNDTSQEKPKHLLRIAKEQRIKDRRAERKRSGRQANMT